MKRKALGKGLDALLPASPQPAHSGLIHVDVSEIAPNPLQPRQQFSSQSLDELANSIRENGIIQPLVLRRAREGYELVAGERRWRAAQRAGARKVPAIIQELSDERMLEIALVENVQRQDLSAIEEAHAYKLLLDQFQLSQEAIAQKVGKSRSAVTNTLRLLKLPKPIQALILAGELSMGHARALLALPDGKAQLQLAREIQQKGLSVREVERRVQRRNRPQPAKQQRRPDPNLVQATRKLEEHCKTRVEIVQHGHSGRIVLHYSTAEELDRLYELIVG